jgi:hypothetical protein
MGSSRLIDCFWWVLLDVSYHGRRHPRARERVRREENLATKLPPFVMIVLIHYEGRDPMIHLLKVHLSISSQ